MRWVDFKDKISNLINSQVFDFVLEDQFIIFRLCKSILSVDGIKTEIQLTNIGDDRSHSIRR